MMWSPMPRPSARKGCDWIVANDVSPATGIMGGSRECGDADLGFGGRSWPRMGKDEVARKLAARIAEALAADGGAASLRRGYLDKMKGRGMGPVVQVLWEDWADRSLPLPAYQTAGAAGADLCANFPARRPSGRRGWCWRRWAGDLSDRHPGGDPGRVLRCRCGRGRGLASKHGITLPNTPGTIDSDYRGPLGVSLINLGTEPYTIRHGDRVAQAVVAPVVQAGFAVVDSAGRDRAGHRRVRLDGFGTAKP
jgi:dUTP pyrophosphatase